MRIESAFTGGIGLSSKVIDGNKSGERYLLLQAQSNGNSQFILSSTTGGPLIQTNYNMIDT